VYNILLGVFCFQLLRLCCNCTYLNVALTAYLLYRTPKICFASHSLIPMRPAPGHWPDRDGRKLVQFVQRQLTLLAYIP